MWPFEQKHRKAVVVFHIDHNGLAKGAYFRGEADVLIIDERDPKNRVYRMGQETPDDELRRKIGKHPLGRLLADRSVDQPNPAPVLNLHWRTDPPLQSLKRHAPASPFERLMGGDAAQGKVDAPAAGNELRAVRVDAVDAMIGAARPPAEHHHIS